HLGPWAPEFERIFLESLNRGILSEAASSEAKAEYDTKIYTASNAPDLTIVLNLEDQAVLRRVLDTWSNSTTAEILDYVYFQTEPMEHAVRNQPLDFGTIG